MYNAVDLIAAIRTAALEAVEATGPCALMTGTVAGVSPLAISVEQKLTLGPAQLILSSLVQDHAVDVTVAGERHSATVHLGLLPGERVLLLRQQGGQKFLVLDRIRKQGVRG